MRYCKLNRDRKHKPKRGFFYCGCDRALVARGAKCHICGERAGKNFKKDTSAR